jgi:hypothetical protein
VNRKQTKSRFNNSPHYIRVDIFSKKNVTESKKSAGAQTTDVNPKSVNEDMIDEFCYMLRRYP